MGKTLYDVLGVPEDATDEDIRKAYKKMALQYHPDKNKSPEADSKFKSVSEAYEILADKNKRNRYNKSIANPVRFDKPDKQGVPFFFTNTQSSFNTFGWVPEPREQPIKKDPPVVHDLYLSPEDIASGCTKKMKVERKVLNPDRVTSRRESKILVIDVKPGWKEGTKITFKEEGDQKPDSIPSDIVFIIKHKPREKFEGEGSDLKDNGTFPSKEPMSASTVKHLYVAKCMEDLDSQTKVELKVKNLNILKSSAEKVFKAAEASYIDKDEEKAYVQYRRFIELVLLLNSNKEFARNSDCKSLLRNAQVALQIAKDLKLSLLKRYSILQEVKCFAESKMNERISSFQKNKASKHVTPEPEIPKTEGVLELSISSSKLFSLLTNQQSNIILMDTRPPKDFEESHIKHSQCINIPQHLLEPGTTAMKLEGVLPPESLGKWYKRGDADHIILIDWESKDETSHTLHLEVLKQAMSKVS